MAKKDESLKIINDAIRSTFEAADEAAKERKVRLPIRETGTIQYIGKGIARVSGLPNAGSEELLKFPLSKYGLVFGLNDDDTVDVIILDDTSGLSAGDEVNRTNQIVSVPVGRGLLGRIVDALARPLDGKGRINGEINLPTQQPAPAIMDRLPVNVPLQTGIQVIDALIPIGRGQRELILGDRQTGKTAIVVDTIINQKNTGVLCIYCAIGKRSSAIAKVIADLKENGVLDQTIVISSTEEDPPGMNYLAPYSAMTMGEHFRDQGKDVLVVFDDLTRHARSYRELSLLFRRPPAREAYPGDIFYIHSRLLERATNLKEEKGGGSLTALPIIETQAQNLSAYIPTNLISITDGQIYLNPELFRQAQVPAVDVGTSVSRVGGKTQLPAYRTVAGNLRLSYTQFEELETFSRFGVRLDEETRKTLERGRRVREVLKQRQYDTMKVGEQIAVLLSVTEGLFDEIDIKDMEESIGKIRKFARERMGETGSKIESGEKLSDEEKSVLIEDMKSILYPEGEEKERENEEPEPTQAADR